MLLRKSLLLLTLFVLLFVPFTILILKPNTAPPTNNTNDDDSSDPIVPSEPPLPIDPSQPTETQSNTDGSKPVPTPTPASASTPAPVPTPASASHPSPVPTPTTTSTSSAPVSQGDDPTDACSGSSFGTPGDFDFFVFAQLWPAGNCDGVQFPLCKKPTDYIKKHLTVHGAWPTYMNEEKKHFWPECCKVPYEVNSTSISPEVLAEMLERWPDMLHPMPPDHLPTFWKHEYYKHGSCSGMDPDDFFRLALAIHKKIETPDWLLFQEGLEFNEFPPEDKTDRESSDKKDSNSSSEQVAIAAPKTARIALSKLQNLYGEPCQKGQPCMSSFACDDSGVLNQVITCWSKTTPFERIQCPPSVLDGFSCPSTVKLSSF